MVRLKDLAALVKIKKTLIDVYLQQKLAAYLNQKEHQPQGKRKKAGRKGKTVVANTPKAKVRMKKGGFIAKGCGKVMSNRRKVTTIS